MIFWWSYPRHFLLSSDRAGNKHPKTVWTLGLILFIDAIVFQPIHSLAFPRCTIGKTEKESEEK